MYILSIQMQNPATFFISIVHFTGIHYQHIARVPGDPVLPAWE